MLATLLPVAQAQIPLGLYGGSTQFELADAVSVDRAETAVLPQLERAKAFLADRQWDEAIETLRKVMETADGKLLPVSESRLVGVAEACQMQLATLPPEALAIYRGRVDALAQRWYEEGIARRDRRLLRQVVHQAVASSWGDKALLALGEIELEEGNFTAARWHWERILPARPPQGAASTWPGYPDSRLDPATIRARLVLVSILEGSTARAREELDALVRLHPDARGRLGGREVVLAAALGELLHQSALWPGERPDADWPTFAGSPTRNKIARSLVDVGGIAWRAALPRLLQTPPASAGRRASVAEDAAAPLSYHPVVVGSRVFVANQEQIQAFDLATGRPAWGNSAIIYRESRDGPTEGMANPPETLGVARFTTTVAGGRLYARMGPAVTSQPQQTTAPVVGGSLVCLDLAAEGKLIWRIAAEEGWAFEGAPLARGARVYVAMRRNDIRPQAHVACFDAATGRLVWRRFVCAAETPARGSLPQSTHTLLTLAEDTIYCNTNLGAVAALSSDDGRLLWVTLYPRARRGDLMQLAAHWHRDLNPCVVDHDLVLVAPADSPRLLALHAPTGQILWQNPTGADLEDVVHLLGIVDGRLIASGRRLYWIELRGPKCGQIVQHWPNSPDRPGYGRGVLAGGSVVWPTRQKLYLLNAATGQFQKSFELAPLGITGGNLVTAGGMLLVATGRELIALSPVARRQPEPPQVTSVVPLSLNPEP